MRLRGGNGCGILRQKETKGGVNMADSWEALKQDCANCRGCALADTRTNVVFGDGAETAEIMLIGEGPGQHEDEQGVPFVGRAGQLLDDMLEIIHLDRTKVYIANVVKCRPPQNRDPLNVEQDACIGFLRRQAALVKPKIIAYHRNKFAVRGFDKVINVWGADHHGHVARLKGALDALDLNGSERLDIVLMQLVKLLRDGEVVRMSKRTGKAISLHDLLDEVSVDAARWYFNAKPDTQMEFDLGLAVREDSENPIYYVEYAHARICSLLRALESDGVAVPETADLSLLSGEAEKALIKQLAQYCEEIKLAARDYDPSHINRCLQELAGCFHRFYTACRIRGEEPQVAAARLKLADDTRIVLKNGLRLIGVDAPEKM